MAQSSRNALLTAALLSVTTQTACGTVHPTARFQSFGTVDIVRDAEIVKNFDNGDGLSAAPTDGEIIVLIDTLPEGITTNNTSFSVEEGYQHELVGKFALASQGRFYWLVGFPEYDDGWRKGLCYWQAPLHWLTLGLWMLVPTDYACNTATARDKVTFVADVKRLAKEAGADTAIIGFLGINQEEAVAVGGILLRLDPKLKGEELKTKPFEYKNEMARRQ
ncbi:MAG: hypothetical protein AAGA56_07155 [Myxococcota bacterium]